MTILLYTCISLLVAIAVILVLLVLIQKGRGGGLASAFGGVGGHTAFGSKTGDVLTWATSVVFGVFLILSIVTGVVFDKVNQQSRAGRAATAAQTTNGGTNGNAPAEAPADAPEQAPEPAPASPTTR